MTNVAIMAMAWAIGQVESRGDPRAVNGDCVGLHQMRPIQVAEANRVSGRHWTDEDRTNPAASTAMCCAILEDWMMRHRERSPVTLALWWKKGRVGASGGSPLTLADVDYSARVANLYHWKMNGGEKAEVGTRNAEVGNREEVNRAHKQSVEALFPRNCPRCGTPMGVVIEAGLDVWRCRNGECETNRPAYARPTAWRSETDRKE